MKREYLAKIGAREFTVSNVAISGDAVTFEVLGNTHTVVLEDIDLLRQHSDARTQPGYSTPRTPPSSIRTAGAVTNAVNPASAVNSKSLIAPISGVVVALQVQVGSKVGAGEIIAILEAMKMENPIKSDRCGVIKTVHTEAGAQVRTGQPLVSFE